MYHEHKWTDLCGSELAAYGYPTLFARCGGPHRALRGLFYSVVELQRSSIGAIETIGALETIEAIEMIEAIFGKTHRLASLVQILDVPVLTLDVTV